ncbi:MAG: hypothetical protein WBE17_09340, partial [Anaerolineae bacterium]
MTKPLHWNHRAGALGALALALLAQSLLTQTPFALPLVDALRVETAHLLAYGLLAAAMLLFALAAAPEPHAPAWPEPPRPQPRLALAFTWPALSLALA